MISISVAMATFNGRRHIGDQLDSIAAQCYLPSELVVTDDGSTDGTTAIIEDFAKRARFKVKVYKNKSRLGFADNFRRAASLCRSALIAFCDQDDIWYPRKLAKSIEVFEDPDILMVYHNADVLSGEGRVVGTLRPRANRLSIHPPLTLSPVTETQGFTQVFRRSLVDFSDLCATPFPINRATGERIAHDHWMFFWACVLGKIGYLHMPLAAYRQHDSNTIGWTKQQGILDQTASLTINHSARYSRLSNITELFASSLEGAQPRLSGAWLDRATAAVPKLRKMAGHFNDRSIIYGNAPLNQRMNAFYRLLRHGGYSNKWGLGWKALIKDCCFGMPISHLLTARY